MHDTEIASLRQVGWLDVCELDTNQTAGVVINNFFCEIQNIPAELQVCSRLFQAIPFDVHDLASVPLVPYLSSEVVVATIQ